MIIGRREEIEKLEKAYRSDAFEFVAVYGRRRIGKTYLIRNVFEDFTFQYTGIFNISNKLQLEEFFNALKSQGLADSDPAPRSWFDAFHLLEQLIEKSPQKRKVIFIDEMPWMDARNSKFVSALEHFWNGWASARKDVLLIVCGSASSWIINRIFRNRGGLYNRVTYRIHLSQFSLLECEQLCAYHKIPFTRSMILEGYMVMGGVPFYWTKLNPRKSINQNINDLFFKENGELRGEFHYIYASMFNKPEKYVKIVEALAGKKSGLTRDEIIKKTKLKSNGQLSEIIEDLIECGFIRKYCHRNRNIKDALYQLIDCYSLFYFQFLKPGVNTDEEYWMRIMRTPVYNTWCGLSFEKVCLLHTRQIKKALGISGIMANLFSWHVRANDTHPGVQLDLLIDRSDNIINVCEMKYAPSGYTMTKAALENLYTKMSVFSLYAGSQKGIQPVLITSNGAIDNKYSNEIIHQITADQLFK